MRFSREAENLLQQQEFPGNVRMLKNTVERAAILCGDGEVGAEDLGFDLVENGLDPFWMLLPNWLRGSAVKKMAVCDLNTGSVSPMI